METLLRIEVLDTGDEDGLLHYHLCLSDGEQTACLEFYAYADAFTDFGSQLLNFPQAITDRVVFQVGDDDNSWAYHLLLEVFCYEPTGASAIRVKLKRFSSVPYYHASEFFILTVPAALNRLGQGLKSWQPLVVKEYCWPNE